MLMTAPSLSLQTDTKYVCVFWNALFQDPSTIIFVKNLRDMGIVVKIIDAAKPDRQSVRSKKDNDSLSADLPLDKAFTLLPNVACIVLPHDLSALDLLLSNPQFDRFAYGAAEHDVHFVGYIEPIAQYTLNRTSEKSFDWVYPREETDIGAFMNNVAKRLALLLK